MKHLFRLLALGALVLGMSIDTQAQTATKARDTSVRIELRTAYDLWPSDARLKLKDIFTVAEAKAKYPDLWRRATLASDKLTDAQVMDLTLFEAAHTDALWKGGDFIPLDNTFPHGGIVGTANHIIWPPGGYAITRPLEYTKGIIEGAGNGVGNIDYRGRGGSTEIEPWLEQWKDDPKHIIVLKSASHGSNNNLAYSEATILRQFRIKGNAGKWHDPSRAITGLNCWDMGEGSDVTDLFIYHCDTGLNIVRGTPFTASGCISVFSNNCAGVAITGGSTINITTLSGDDNGRLIHSRPGYGRPASCGLNIGAVKSEWLVTDATYGRTPKPNTVELEGWSRVNIGFFSHAMGNVFQDALFVMKPDVNTSHVRVNDFRLFQGANLQLLIRDRVNKEAWQFDNGWASGIQEFRWTSVGGGNLESWPTQAARIDYPFTGGQLGYILGSPTTGQPTGSFDRVNGRPSWSDVTGSSSAPVTPPSTCTYTYSAWGACTNGTQTRTVLTSTPAGCTGTPVTSQSCTTTTPPGAALYTASNVNISSNSGYSLDITDITISRIVLTGYVQNANPNYSAFAVPAGSPSINYISVWPDGSWNTPAGKCTVSTTNGVTTITLPAPMTISRLGTFQNSGGALQYRATKLELF